MIGEALLQKMKQGDPESLEHFKRILGIDGVIAPEDVFELQLAAVSAALAQNGRGNGAAAAKLDIYFGIFEKLVEIRAKSVMENPDKRAVVEALASESDSDVAKAWTYDKLMMLALCSPEGDKEGLEGHRKKMMDYIESNNYSPAIQIGLALARAKRGETEPGAEFISLANKCLLNAARYGEEETRRYAAEAIMAGGSDSAKAGLLNHMLDIAEFASGPARQDAVSTILQHFHGDAFARTALHEMGLANAEIKACIAGVAKAGDGAASEAAGSLMASIRSDDEKDRARADREFLLEIEYPQDYKPQRMYVELIFNAVETVMGPAPRNPVEEMNYEVALLQLVTQGADPGNVGSMFETRSDKQNLRMVMRNVENALLYAVNNSRSDESLEQAAEGLERIGTERVADILDRIAARHGSESREGAVAARTAERIRDSWLVEIVELDPPAALKRPPLPPPIQAGVPMRAASINIKTSLG